MSTNQKKNLKFFGMKWEENHSVSKFIGESVFIRGEESSQINDFSFLLKKLGEKKKNQTKPKVSRERKCKQKSVSQKLRIIREKSMKSDVVWLRKSIKSNV